jgi:hypothetical protein
VDEVLYQPSDGVLRRQTRRWALVRRALRQADVVHFNSGSTCLPHAAPLAREASLTDRVFHAYCLLVQRRDLDLLRMAGIPMVVTFQGSDVRPSRFFRHHLEAGELAGLEPYLGAARDAHKRHLVSSFCRSVGHVFFLNPDLGAVLPPERASFLPYAVLLPDPQPPRRTSSRLLVAHAPTNRAVKGTRFLIEAVQSLSNKVELDLIEDASHEETLNRLARADLVVDQMVLGWYGTTAVEAMALGRPVVASILEEYLDCVPSELLRDLPILRSSRHELADTLRRCLHDRAELQERAAAGPAFARSWHTPARVAEQTRAVYDRLLAPSPR